MVSHWYPLNLFFSIFSFPNHASLRFADLRSTKFSHISIRENRKANGDAGSLHVFICIYLLVVWILSSQEGRGNFFKEKGGVILRRHRGLNLDCGLIPSPISLWFSQSLTCNFPSVNLSKSPSWLSLTISLCQLKHSKIQWQKWAGSYIDVNFTNVYLSNEIGPSVPKCIHFSSHFFDWIDH